MRKSKLGFVTFISVFILASCWNLSSSSLPLSSIPSTSTSTISSASSTTSNASTSTPTSSSVTTSNSADSSSSSSAPISLLGGLKGSYTNLYVTNFFKVGNNRIYVIRLNNPSAGNTPATNVFKLVIASATNILFEKTLSTSPSTSPVFNSAVLFDENNLILNYFLQSTMERSMTIFNLTTQEETSLGNFVLNVIPDASYNELYLKNRKYVLVGSKGTEYGLFKINPNLTTTLLTAVPQIFIPNLRFQLEPNYDYPFIFITSDNAVTGMNYTPPTKSYDLLVKTSDFSIVHAGEKTIGSSQLGTSYEVNFYTNAIAVQERTTAENPNLPNTYFNTDNLFVYSEDGTLKINQAYHRDSTAIIADYSFIDTTNYYNFAFIPTPVTGIVLTNPTAPNSSSYNVTMYNSSLTQTRTFTITNSTPSYIKVDKFGNVHALENANGSNTFKVYGIDGTDYVYTKDGKHQNFNFDVYFMGNYYYEALVSRNRIPLLVEILNDQTVNLVTFSSGAYKIYNFAFNGSNNLNNLTYGLFDNDQLLYASVSYYAGFSSQLSFQNFIINFATNTSISVNPTFPGQDQRLNFTPSYSNNFAIDLVINSPMMAANTTVGLVFVNVITGTFTFVAFATPFDNYAYFESFVREDNGAFAIRLRSSSTNYLITGTTTDLTSVEITSVENSFSAYTGLFENIINNVDFVFTDQFVPPTQNTPPSSLRNYYVGTNYNGQLSSLTQVTGPNVPTSGSQFQLIVSDDTGTTNDKLFLYFPSINLMFDLLSANFPSYKGYFTTDGFTLLDENLNETDQYFSLVNVKISGF